MRIGVVGGRAVEITAQGSVVDIADATGGLFGPDPMSLYQQWDAFAAHMKGRRSIDPGSVIGSAESVEWENPVPNPRQIFAVGMNYAEHAEEAGFVAPEEPAVFTKFVTSLAGPTGEIVLPTESVDWEIELVAVIGTGGRSIPARDAWTHVAGITVGQDLSERVLQRIGPLPQFSLAKSYAAFSPLGPFVVTPDEVADPDDLELGCSINGETVQQSRTSRLIFSVPTLIEKLSLVTELLPGDIIFTGTPSGVGAARTPARFLAAGDELVSYVKGIGEMRHTFVAA